MRRCWGLILLLLLLSSFFLGGCRAAPADVTSTPTYEQPIFPADTRTPTTTATVAASVTPTDTEAPSETPQPTPTDTQEAVFPISTATDTPSFTETPTFTPTFEPTFTDTPLPSPTPLDQTYPLPIATATYSDSGYPIPILRPPTSVYSGYPEPVASATQVSWGAYPTPGATSTRGMIITSTPAPSLTPTRRFTPTRPTFVGPTATDFVGQPILTRMATGSVITLWHGWTGQQATALDHIVDAFQDAFPDISFIITYVPQDELRGRYEAASYYGGGPNLLLGPSSWGWKYAQSDLVVDLSPYASEAFLATINPVALETLRLDDQLIGLPYTQQGYVLYRNPSIISQPADTFEALTASAKSATRGGRVGAYLERESIVSSAMISGLGGQMMDDQGYPAFNSPQGLDWLDLLAEYEQAGLAGMHTNRDFDLFEAGKIGVIVEGTWRMERLVKSLGAEKVVIDPWPKRDSGRLSGYVQTEAVYLNTNTQEKDLLASLRFMGFLLTRDVQTLLGESGFIPTVLQAAPRDVHTNQAMEALKGGTAWPLVDEQLLIIYWNALDEAITNVFNRDFPPDEALRSASEVVIARLRTTNRDE